MFRQKFNLWPQKENQRTLSKALKYLNVIYHYCFFFIKYNSPFVLKRLFEVVLKILSKIVALFMIQILFTVDMFTVPVYYPNVVKENLGYLRSNKLLNTTQLSKIYYTLTKNHRSLEFLTEDLYFTLMQLKIPKKDINLMLDLLQELYKQYGCTENELSNPFWDINLSNTLTRSTTGIKKIPPSLAHFLGIQEEYTDTFLDPTKTKTKFRDRFSGFMLGILLSLEHLCVVNYSNYGKTPRKVILAVFFLITGILVALIVNMSGFFYLGALKLTSGAFWTSIKNALIVTNHKVFFNNLLTNLWKSFLVFTKVGFCFVDLTCLVSVMYLIVDTIYYIQPLFIKILQIARILTSTRQRALHLMPYESLAVKFKMKYYEILKNSCLGDCWYLRVLYNHQNKNKKNFAANKWAPRGFLYKVTPVFSARQGVTLSLILAVLLNQALMVSDLVQNMYLNIQDAEDFLQYLQDSYLDIENYVIQGYNEYTLWACFVFAVFISKTLLITLPTMALYYIINPVQYYYSYFTPHFSFLVPYLYLLKTRKRDVDKKVVSRVEKQKNAVKLVLFLAFFVLIGQPLCRDIPAFFTPMTVNFYVSGYFLKKMPYKPFFSAFVVDSLAYYLNDSAFNSIPPFNDLKSDLYRRM